MIRPGFPPEAERRALTVIARNGLEEHRVARRANALILLNGGWNDEQVARAFLIDDDTVRQWHKAYQTEGIDDLKSFGHERSSCRLTEEQFPKMSGPPLRRLPPEQRGPVLEALNRAGWTP